MEVLYVLRSICKKTSINILKPRQQMDLSLQESLEGGQTC